MGTHLAQPKRMQKNFDLPKPFRRANIFLTDWKCAGESEMPSDCTAGDTSS